MKHTFTLTIFVFLVATSCHKEVDPSEGFYLHNVQTALADSMSANDYNMLDFEQSVLSAIDSVELYFIKVPFKGKETSKDFILVQTDRNGYIKSGKIIHLDGEPIEIGEGKIKRKTFSGSLMQSSLNRKETVVSQIVNGHIKHKQRSNNALREDLVEPGVTLPEVVVFSSSSSGGGSYYSTWMMLSAVTKAYSSSGSYSGGYYGLINVSGGGGGYNTGSYGQSEATGGGPHEEGPIFLDLERQSNNPAISIEDYLRCFEAVPDAGSNCFIELFVDIPVDSDPNKLVDVNTGSPGHVFFELSKRNGTQGVAQNIGFYPESGWKVTLSNAPVAGKFVDNARHEFNASFKMDLTPEKFRYMLNEIRYLSKTAMYDIDEYNCTDFALDVFNAARSSKLEIPLCDIPGGIAPFGTRTPQGLFQKLKQMKTSGTPESANIDVDIIKGWSGGSKGPCN